MFSDDDDIIYQFRRCVGLNGINVIARNSDLLDRTVLFNLEEIKEENRKKKLEMLAEFEEERSSIFSGILTVLSKALAIKKTIKLEKHQRLADFHEWGCAIAVALGYTTERFSEVYAIKVGKQNEEALSASSVASVLLEYLKDIIEKEEYSYSSEDEVQTFTVKKTSTELFMEVTEFANEKKMKTSKGYWPTSANQFSRKLNEVLPNLEKAGVIIVQHSDGSSRSKIIDITGLMSKPKSDSFWDKAVEGR